MGSLRRAVGPTRGTARPRAWLGPSRLSGPAGLRRGLSVGFSFILFTTPPTTAASVSETSLAAGTAVRQGLAGGTGDQASERAVPAPRPFLGRKT